MSAFYVGCESLSMLTDVITRYQIAGYNAFGFDIPDRLHRCFIGKKETDIFQALSDMNKKALEQKYGHDGMLEMSDDFGYEDGHDIWKAREYGKVQAWHYQLLKSLQCYIYQCSEGDVSNCELYKGMEEFENRLAKFIACNQPEYAQAEWR